MSDGASDNLRPLVLVVDDHADTVGLMGRLLRRHGFDVVQAGSVAAAMAVPTDRPVDLLVSDVTLPDGTGHDLMRQLLRRTPTVRGIAVSGHGSDDDRSASLASGFDRHVTKPIDVAGFAVVCRDVLADPRSE